MNTIQLEAYLRGVQALAGPVLQAVHDLTNSSKAIRLPNHGLSNTPDAWYTTKDFSAYRQVWAMGDITYHVFEGKKEPKQYLWKIPLKGSVLTATEVINDFRWGNRTPQIGRTYDLEENTRDDRHRQVWMPVDINVGKLINLTTREETDNLKQYNVHDFRQGPWIDALLAAAEKGSTVPPGVLTTMERQLNYAPVNVPGSARGADPAKVEFPGMPASAYRNVCSLEG